MIFVFLVLLSWVFFVLTLSVRQFLCQGIFIIDIGNSIFILSALLPARIRSTSTVQGELEWKLRLFEKMSESRWSYLVVFLGWERNEETEVLKLNEPFHSAVFVFLLAAAGDVPGRGAPWRARFRVRRQRTSAGECGHED